MCQHEGVNTMNLRVQWDMWQIVPISSAISFDLVHEPAGRAGFHAWQFWSVSTLVEKVGVLCGIAEIRIPLVL